MQTGQDLGHKSWLATIWVCLEETMPRKPKKRVNFGPVHIEVRDSNLVDRVHYDPETNTLDAVFKAGTRYRYRGVTPKIFAKFVLARSMGKFYNRFIKSAYPSEKVEVRKRRK
jgi:hypothetical protein